MDVTLICPGYIDTSLFSSGVYEGALDESKAKAAIPFAFMDVETTVKTILAGVQRRQLVVAFPGYVRAGWILSRLSPGLFRWYNARQFKKILAGG